MFIVLLVLILSNPDEPLMFGVVKKFDDSASCYKYLQNMDVSDEKKKNLGCIEIRKSVET